MTITRSTLLDVPLSRLRPYDRNPRKNDPAVEAVAKSLAEFGYVKVSVLVDEEMILLAGHTTLKAMKRLGWTACPEVTVIDGLSTAQKTAYRLADNKLAEIAAWDDDALRAELQELQIEGFDLSLAGFDPAEWFPEAQPDPPHARVSEAEELARTWQTAPGQLWRLGRHRLLCGDATSAGDLARLMDGETMDLVLTDPPYGIGIVSGGSHGTVGGDGALKFGTIGGVSIVPATTYPAIIGDDSTDAARAALSLLTDLPRIVFGGNFFSDFLPPSRCWIVWDKENTGNFSDAELAWTSFDRTVKLYRWMWNGLARKGDRATEGATRSHPTQKPVGLFKEIINDFADPGAAVIDPFIGAGTTLIACEQTGRRCFGMEIDPCYVAVVLQRYQDLTGVAPELVEPEEDDGAT